MTEAAPSASTGAAETAATETTTETTATASAAPPSVTDTFTGFPAAFASDPIVSEFESPEALLSEFKNLRSVQANRENNGMTALPGENSSPEEWDSFYQKLGKPTSPAEYELKQPEGMLENMAYSDEKTAEFAQFAHEHNFTKAQAEAGFELWNKMVQEMAQQQQELTENALVNNLTQLEEMWGGPQESPAFQQHHKNAMKAFNMVADEGLADRFKSDPALASNPIVLETLSRLGAAMRSDTVPSVGDTIPIGGFETSSLSAVESAIKKFTAEGKFKQMFDASQPDKQKALKEEWNALHAKREELLQGA